LQYNLENLHWREFERLITFYLKEKIGEGVWTFDGSQDKGRDAEFRGEANEFPSKSCTFRGDWIFQVKHKTTRTRTLSQVESKLLQDLKDELEKIFRKHHFRCDNYIYITNISVSNNFRSLATSVFDDFFRASLPTGIKLNFRVIEYKDLEPFIAKNPSVRRAFPSLLTFTDLENVFLKKEETKNKGYLRSARNSINRFVSTTHYATAVDLLAESSFLMIVGDPKSGKTSIVEALAIAFLEEGHFKPYFVRTTDEFFTIAAYLAAGERALFICDDIFGQHELDGGKLEDWTNYFQSVMGLVDENHRFVFTTRKYIYEQFANKSGLRRFFPEEENPSRYVIKLSSLTKDEREQILVKHLQHSTLPVEILRTTFSAKEQILACPDFSPEVIRSLVSLLGSIPSHSVRTVIASHIKHPNQYLYDFFDNISADKRLLLLSVAVAPNRNATKVESSFVGLLEDCLMTPSVRFEAFIDELDGSIIRKREYLESNEVEYYHPSMYDVVVGICGKDKYYRGLMLKHVNLELLWLLTIRGSSQKPNAIHIRADEFQDLLSGLELFLTKEATLKDSSTLLQWISSSLSVDLAYNITFAKLVTDLKTLVRSVLAKIEFYESHVNESLEQWINLFNKLHSIPGQTRLQYKESLRELHRNSASDDYWRLMFVVEAVNPGFIDEGNDQKALDHFIQTISRRIANLRLGLNFVENRPKTAEGWLSSFYQINELISKMKKAYKGKQIIDNYLLTDWELIKRHCDFARQRHYGMVKRGYWKTIPSTRRMF
jgi:hypothetical protein